MASTQRLSCAHALAPTFLAGTTIPLSERIAKPSADAPLYRKGQVVLPAAAKAAAAAAKAAAAQKRAASANIVPAVPSVNAWQKPLAAALQPAAGSQQGPPPPPPPPPPKQEQQQEQQEQQVQQQVEQAAPAPALTPEPLQAVAPASAEPALLSVDSTGSSGGLGGWNPIGSSSFGLGSGTGIALAAAASADSSRDATPALVGSAGELGGLAAAAGGDLLVYPFPAAGSGLHGSLSAASSLGGVAAAAGPGRPWEQRNGGLGGGLGPTGDESAFLSQLMQGVWVPGGRVLGGCWTA